MRHNLIKSDTDKITSKTQGKYSYCKTTFSSNSFLIWWKTITKKYAIMKWANMPMMLRLCPHWSNTWISEKIPRQPSDFIINQPWNHSTGVKFPSLNEIDTHFLALLDRIECWIKWKEIKMWKETNQTKKSNRTFLIQLRHLQEFFTAHLELPAWWLLEEKIIFYFHDDSEFYEFFLSFPMFTFSCSFESMNIKCALRARLVQPYPSSSRHFSKNNARLCSMSLSDD